MTTPPAPGRVRAALRVADYFAGGPDEMYQSEQPRVLQALEVLRDASRTNRELWQFTVEQLMLADERSSGTAKIFHLVVRQAQAAYSAGLRDGPEACMEWLGNALDGPGNLPPEGSDPDWYAADAWRSDPDTYTMPAHCATVSEPATERTP